MSKKITKEAIQSFNNRQESGFKEIFYDLLHELQVYSSTIIYNWYESEEVVLKCFMKLWNSDATFNSREALCSYIYKLVKRESLNYNRSEACRMDKRTYDEKPALEIEDKVEHDKYVENLKKLNVFIELLPHRCQEVMRLHLLGRTTKEISKILDISVSTVDNQKSRAIASLREQFNNQKQTYEL